MDVLHNKLPDLYSLKYDANNQDVYDVAQALMGLQDYTVLEVLKQDSTTLAE